MLNDYTFRTHKRLIYSKRRTWDQPLLEIACDKLTEDLPIEYGAPGGKEVYRKTLALR